MGAFQLFQNPLQDRLKLAMYLLICEAKHAALLLLVQPAGSLGIVCDLSSMAIAIDLNAQLCFWTEEVKNVWPDRILSTKAKSVQLPTA